MKRDALHMIKQSDWSILECTQCHQIFAVPNQMMNEEGENYQYFLCPYCGKEGDLGREIVFISNQNMDCEVNKIVKWEVK
jgi:DNA-directed RNA polymerase subunit RPC12/RpoP